jgi:hypothetical protein
MARRDGASSAVRRPADSLDAPTLLRCGPPWNFDATDLSVGRHASRARADIAYSDSPAASRTAGHERDEGDSSGPVDVELTCEEAVSRMNKPLAPPWLDAEDLSGYFFAARPLREGRAGRSAE